MGFSATAEEDKTCLRVAQATFCSEVYSYKIVKVLHCSSIFGNRPSRKEDISLYRLGVPINLVRSISPYFGEE